MANTDYSTLTRFIPVSWWWLVAKCSTRTIVNLPIWATSKQS